jgi:hypothetical protein
MTSNYSLSNFISQPTIDDNVIKIYDRNKKLKYTIEPMMAYFFTKAAFLIIKIEDRNDILLDFSNSIEASQAMAKLNQVKKELISKTSSEQKNLSVIYSKANLNMSGKNTLVNGDLACDTAILNSPKSGSSVRVFINGLEVNVGGKIYPYDCYFSSNNGQTVRSIGDERYGDKLYWNPIIAGYNLSTTDLIDFDYLIISDL